MEWWWFACGLLAVLMYWLFALNKTANRYKKRGFPCLPAAEGWKQFWLQITRLQATHVIADRNYKYFEGHRIGCISQRGMPQMLVRDPELIHKILIKDFSYFHDHEFPVDLELNPLEGHLFNMKGAQWRALRNKLAPAFTTGKLKRMMPQIAACADTLVEILSGYRPDQDVNIRDYLSRFAIDVVGSCAFGVETGSLKNPNCEFKRVAAKIFNPGRIQLLKVFAQFLVPRVAKLLKLKTTDEEVTRFVFGLTRQIFEQRTKSGEKRNDFIDLLLQLKHQGSVDCDPKDLREVEENSVLNQGNWSQDRGEESEKLELTDEVLTAQAFVFLVGGWENVAVIFVFTLYCLAKYPDTQAKARQEIKRIKRKYEGNLCYEALREMVYLDACISEALRLYPPNVGLFHSCTRDYTMDDGRVIDKGTLMYIPIYSLQRDPAYFDKPEEFRPERFMPDNKIPSSVYMPFGDGPRVCIARRFALLEVKILMSKLLDSLEFKNSPKMKEPINIDPDFFVIDIKGGLWVRMQKVED